jgi:hypothetical protein
MNMQNGLQASILQQEMTHSGQAKLPAKGKAFHKLKLIYKFEIYFIVFKILYTRQAASIVVTVA